MSTYCWTWKCINTAFTYQVTPYETIRKKAREKSETLSETKVKAGIFIGLQIYKLLTGEGSPKLFTGAEQKSWNSFKEVVFGFLGNFTVENYRELVDNMLDDYKAMGCILQNVYKSANAAYSFRYIWTQKYDGGTTFGV